MKRSDAGEAVFEKNDYSGFSNTGFEQSLRKQGIETLRCGVQTNVCVESTLRDAHNRYVSYPSAPGPHAVISSDLSPNRMRVAAMPRRWSKQLLAYLSKPAFGFNTHDDRLTHRFLVISSSSAALVRSPHIFA